MTIENSKGAALVTAIAVVVMMLILAAAVNQILSGYYIYQARAINRAKAYAAAEAGVAEAYRRLFFGQTGSFTINNFPWIYNTDGSVAQYRPVTVTVAESPAGSGKYKLTSSCGITQ